MTCKGCGQELDADAVLEHRSPAGDRYCTLQCAFARGVGSVVTRHIPNQRKRAQQWHG